MSEDKTKVYKCPREPFLSQMRRPLGVPQEIINLIEDALNKDKDRSDWEWKNGRGGFNIDRDNRNLRIKLYENFLDIANKNIPKWPEEAILRAIEESKA